ncbi:T9SS type A sorting domain-containing protein [Lewinella cohaerens]|uniref:T9SS type A sorting domain-containing protein n=1 Tax=Lewinella cohaerens TaxID=70995 RepID=UPI00035E27F6|nr:T9SS type A sorting domain-containing protein [Lewinella cohaerens]
MGFAMLLSWSVQAQFPCFPGQISVAPGYEASFCDDGSEPILIRFKGKPAGLPHAFVVINADDVIVHIDYANTIDFSGLGDGLRVYTFSLIGSITAEVGDILGQTELASGCYSLSANFIEIDSNGGQEGGMLAGGPFNFCVGDGVADMLEPGSITLTGNAGTNSAWVVTDDQGNILGLPPIPSAVDFDGAGVGTCLIWHLSFEDGLVGAEVGLNAADLEGCFDLSNPISVNRNQPDGGTLEGGPFTFCVGDGVADMLEPGSITLTGNSGTNSAWVVTDDQGNILGLPPMPSAVDFDGAGVDTCLVWHLSFEDGLVGAEVGLNAADLEGCFDLSNPISVNRIQPNGGTLEGGVYEFCVGDGVADMLAPGSITLTGNTGTNSAWVVTDDQGNILGLPPMPSAVDFDGAGAGTCLVWHLSFEDGLVGAEVGLNAADLEGCFDLSNPISVNRNQPDGGTLEGGPFTFCVGDGVADMLEPGAITLTGNSGTNSAWVVTDDQGNILGLPPMPSAVDFDGAGAGTCLVWHLSFEDGLVGAEVGLNAADLEGCFDLSNPISVDRNQPDGGTLEGGPFTFCVGDGVADMLEPGAITLTGNSGTNSAWVVTDDQGNILGLPPMPSAVDFDGAGAGTCLVWHLSFEDGLVGAEVGLNAADLEGCFDLSNPISVNRNQPDGGTLEGGVYEFCVGDGVADMLEPGSITLTGNSGANSAWVVTDDQGNILGLPPMPSAVDFDDAGAGTCLVWHLSFEDGLVGAEVGLNAADLEGCFDLSNPITINRVEGADCDNLCNSNGGFLTGGPFTFCVGDDIVDNLPEDAITLTGNSGTNSAWVVTDEQGNILGLPPTPSAVDFDGAGAGTCLVWHLSFEDGLVGAEVGLNATDLEGCFDLSNPISVNRNQPEGGTLEGGPFTFCVGDGVADMLEPGSITLTGNSGTNSAWVVTDDQGNILGLPPMPSAVDFDGAGAGTCLVWHLSFEDGLVGAEVGLNAADLQGCFSLSNPITVNRNQPDGGMLEGGPFSFCVSDGVADMIEEGAITLIGNSGGNSAWVVTDDQGNILGLPPMPSAVDFDGAGEGTCLVWHLSFEDGLIGAEVGLNASDLQGCFDLSNPIAVERTAVNGGMVSTIDGETNVTVTVGDGEADIIQFVNTAAVGENFTYVITDENNIILGLPSGDSADFEDAPAGICRVWGLAYTGNIIAVVGDNAAEVALSDGCFNLSDIFITVNRTEGFAPNIPQSNAVTEGPAILEVQLFPNPAVDQLQVALTTNSVSNENIELTIVDLNGQVLYQRIISADQVRTTVDVANLPAGTYFLRSNDGKQVITKRFIKA